MAIVTPGGYHPIVHNFKLQTSQTEETLFAGDSSEGPQLNGNKNVGEVSRVQLPQPERTSECSIWKGNKTCFFVICITITYQRRSVHLAVALTFLGIPNSDTSQDNNRITVRLA